eukprot:NODE_23606_length_659_cov_1.043233.p1 GENE.NODE_23606_length_659_cov_1.043233~~NODE_23606_length_659_cov_1.043233.p1  ORF type:complete len:193 (+),score=41.20 NODE_23606_length_659_cov_1.043233:1-579(+)
MFFTCCGAAESEGTVTPLESPHGMVLDRSSKKEPLPLICCLHSLPPTSQRTSPSTLKIYANIVDEDECTEGGVIHVNMFNAHPAPEDGKELSGATASSENPTQSDAPLVTSEEGTRTQEEPLDRSGTFLAVIRIGTNKDGAAASWNACHYYHQLMCGAHIVEVNDCRGNSTALAAALKKGGKVLKLWITQKR